MTDDSNNPSQKRDLEDVLELGPESRIGDEGETVKGGRQEGPNSDRGGQPLAPQVGDPRAKDRRPN